MKLIARDVPPRSAWALEQGGVLAQHGGGPGQAGGHHAGGEFLEGLTEDLLATVVAENALIEGDALKACGDGGFRHALGGGLLPHALQPAVEIAGLAGGRGKRGACEDAEGEREGSEIERHMLLRLPGMEPR